MRLRLRAGWQANKRCWDGLWILSCHVTSRDLTDLTRPTVEPCPSNLGKNARGPGASGKVGSFLKVEEGAFDGTLPMREGASLRRTDEIISKSASASAGQSQTQTHNSAPRNPADDGTMGTRCNHITLPPPQSAANPCSHVKRLDHRAEQVQFRSVLLMTRLAPTRQIEEPVSPLFQPHAPASQHLILDETTVCSPAGSSRRLIVRRCR